jgi:hypothetical protein
VLPGNSDAPLLLRHGYAAVFLAGADLGKPDGCPDGVLSPKTT